MSSISTSMLPCRNRHCSSSPPPGPRTAATAPTPSTAAPPPSCWSSPRSQLSSSRHCHFRSDKVRRRRGADPSGANSNFFFLYSLLPFLVVRNNKNKICAKNLHYHRVTGCSETRLIETGHERLSIFPIIRVFPFNRVACRQVTTPLPALCLKSSKLLKKSNVLLSNFYRLKTIIRWSDL